MIKALLVKVFCIIAFIATGSHPQIKNIGVPFTFNYSKESYNASGQNWSITQDRRGFMYFGNNDGILRFNGTTWEIFPATNSSIVRSVMAVGDTIFAGAFDEIAFLAPDPYGKMTYTSLNHLIPEEHREFGEVWSIYQHTGEIIFHSFNYIFIYSRGAIRVIEPISSFCMLHYTGKKLFVVDTETGLMQLENDHLKLVSDDPVFLRNEIRFAFLLDHQRLMIGTSNEGVFILDQRGDLSPWMTEVNNYLQENTLFSATLLSNGYLAFGTVRNGIYISNKDGVVIQNINRTKGLQNNTVLSLFQDRSNNLWLGLNNGIDFIEILSPVSKLNHNFNIESAYTSLIHNDILYVGTNQGLFAKNIDKLALTGSTETKFKFIEGTEGQVWSLKVIDNTLFCGHNFGCFIIEGFSARKISDVRGFWTFLQHPTNKNIIIAGTYTGLVTLKQSGGEWAFLDNVYGFDESSRSIHMDKYNNLWISHGYKGLFKLKLNNEIDSVIGVKLFRGQYGLPQQLPYNIQNIHNEIFFTTHEGIFQYDDKTNSFKIAENLNRLFEDSGLLVKIYNDLNGNIWYFTSSKMGVMRLLEDGTYRKIEKPFAAVNESLIPAFQHIFIDATNVLIGSQDGLIHYDPSIIKDYNLTENIYIKEVLFYGRQKTKTFHFPDDIHYKHGRNHGGIPFAMNSVSIRFTIPYFNNPGKIKFSYRLVGFDDNWSEWDVINIKEYTNLREGDYIFEVKAKNIYGNESTIKSMPFTVKPPFLRSQIAFGIYSIIFMIVVAGNIIYIRKRIIKVRQKEILKHKKRLEIKEQAFKEKSDISEREITHLRSEILRKEMVFKNKELANTTMQLIQKNKSLTSLKSDLEKLLKTIPSKSPENHTLTHILKRINRDIRSEKQWAVFNKYFDEVHQDFINRLKSEYPHLSPRELRLCAYLKMNISTKEISPLMNISIRGVEISRYRLRKKLNLSTETNLTSFLLNF